jgi:fructosamine-3-kinase
LKGEFEGTSAIASITPDFVPKPLGWGTYVASPDTHFYLCEFHELVEELPDPGAFCAKVAELHRTHSSDKYGFHVVTYNGDLPQENGYTDTWEEFFANGLRHMFKLNLERGGPCDELQQLMPAMFEKVIPRLLRPLESGGNSIKPSLVHGDLWCGNAAIDVETEQPLVFDPSCFWAHNECKICNCVYLSNGY